jgi:hypothetical protein
MGPEIPENSNHTSVDKHYETNPDSLLDTSATHQRPDQLKKKCSLQQFYLRYGGIYSDE